MSSGTLDVVVDPEQDKGVASVRVTVRYFREDVRDVAKACLVERGEGVSGVGVFVGVLFFPQDHSCRLPPFLDPRVVVHRPWGRQAIIHGDNHRSAL